ncbi:Hypothetical protein KVN_LOCUS265 [uncultured virus]|nr:Hypothetical protein KVN_LOCUS265 [uncultured virus]
MTHNCNCNKKKINAIEKYKKTHKAHAFVLSCIDYRFIDYTSQLLEDSYLNKDYDFTTLAGASLGFNQKKFNCWRKTFIDLVKLAIELHDIKEIIVIDHMDCGAYALIYPDININTKEEKKLHIKNILQFIKEMKKIFPNLKYKGYLLDINGKPIKISP